MAVGLALGPVRLAVRAGLRAAGGRAWMRRWQGPATQGLTLGFLAAPALAGAWFGGDAAVLAAVLGLSLLLFVQDVAWRWLPLEWSLPLLALGLIAGFLGETPGETLAGAALGGGLLLALQLGFRHARGVEALGTGDIWLAAGLGGFAGPTTIAWVLGLAALSALAVQTVKTWLKIGPSRQRWGVAFGSHIIGVFLIVAAT
jgi:leader peptidase (prepilin peptidase)/N-methyltransferase